MLDHVTIRASDPAASARFYETVLLTILDGWDDFRMEQADDEHPATRGLHVGFVAPSRELADEFWRVGTEAGYRDDGAPGPRPEYGPDYYGAFLLDPDGNSVEAVHHDSLPTGGSIDHIWIRVADVETSKRFYESIAPRSGFALNDEHPGRAQFGSGDQSFSLLDGPPTENLHLAFAAGGEVLADPDGNTVELGS